MKYRCRASEAGSVEAGRPAPHRFFSLIASMGQALRQPNRASWGALERTEPPNRASGGARGSQIASRATPKHTKSVPRASKSTPRTPQSAPRTPKSAPRVPRERPNAPKNVPRTTPKRFMLKLMSEQAFSHKFRLDFCLCSYFCSTSYFGRSLKNHCFS